MHIYSNKFMFRIGCLDCFWLLAYLFRFHELRLYDMTRLQGPKRQRRLGRFHGANGWRMPYRAKVGLN